MNPKLKGRDYPVANSCVVLMKNFLKPTVSKIILLLLLLSLSFIKDFTVTNIMGDCFDCPPLYGFPMPFYNTAGNYGPAGKNVESHFEASSFALNLILLYVISGIVTLLGNKIRLTKRSK